MLMVFVIRNNNARHAFFVELFFKPFLLALCRIVVKSVLFYWYRVAANIFRIFPLIVGKCRLRVRIFGAGIWIKVLW
jgi:hypothetical protein